MIVLTVCYANQTHLCHKQSTTGKFTVWALDREVGIQSKLVNTYHEVGSCWSPDIPCGALGLQQGAKQSELICLAECRKWARQNRGRGEGQVRQGGKGGGAVAALREGGRGRCGREGRGEGQVRQGGKGGGAVAALREGGRGRCGREGRGEGQVRQGGKGGGAGAALREGGRGRCGREGRGEGQVRH